jgi:hypothetical protein
MPNRLFDVSAKGRRRHRRSCLSVVRPHFQQAESMPNPSVKGTATSGLRPLAPAPYVER